MKCDDCKYAEWKRTKNGRLHPDKSGRCLVNKVVRLPECLIGTSGYPRNVDELVIKGRHIERDRMFERCAYYGPNKG